MKNIPILLAECVQHHLETYLHDLQGSAPGRMYDMLIAAVEKPLLELVMKHTENNQSKASQWLGINRNTLRKKLLQHHIVD
jgi:Fis family transcriptional regulator